MGLKSLNNFFAPERPAEARSSAAVRVTTAGIVDPSGKTPVTFHSRPPRQPRDARVPISSLRAQRSNPESFHGGSLDCFAALAMTEQVATPRRSNSYLQTQTQLRSQEPAACELVHLYAQP